MISFINSIIGFVLCPTVLKPSIPPRCYNIVDFTNVTRKDVVDDVFGFVAGALAAEILINSVRFLQEIERNRSIENALNFLDTF